MSHPTCYLSLTPDLDSLASSIAYAYLDNSLNANRSLALNLTPRKLMNLRPENNLALQRASIPAEVLLHAEDLPRGTEGLIPAGVTIGLVDHNVLLPRFGSAADYSRVTSIIDHHEDEHQSLNANPRIVKVPTGSSSSLVTNHFAPTWKNVISSPAGVNAGPPPELATLLLSALLIDTQGLKSGGKATRDDYDAAAFLFPLSTLPQVQALTDADSDISPSMTAFADELTEIKYDVSNLTTYELLERDYKQYSWDTAAARFPILTVGLSTVPRRLRDQLAAETDGWTSYLSTADEYMLELGLDVVGVSTTFKTSKGKSRRELVIAVRAGGALADLEEAQYVMGQIARGLEHEEALFELQPWSEKGDDVVVDAGGRLDTPNRVVRVWKQANHHSTRKQIAPALHAIVSALE